MKPRIGSLFSGSGMLDEAVRSVLGGEVVWHAEINPAAAKVLDHRYPGVPNLGDITAIDWAAVERVDVMTGGFPCTDVSAAGKQAGLIHGTRSGLWHEFVRAIAALRPRLVVIENVRGLLTSRGDTSVEYETACLAVDRWRRVHHLIDRKHRRAVIEGKSFYVRQHANDRARILGRLNRAMVARRRAERRIIRAIGTVLGTLARLGYDAQWHGLRAADVGAPHGRFRIFVVATDTERGGRDRWASDARRGTVGGVAATGTGAIVASDSSSGQLARPGATGDGLRLATERRARPATDAEGDGRDEGRPESARLVRGPDAAERGAVDHSRCCHRGHRDESGHPVWFCGGGHHCATPDPDRDALRQQPFAVSGRSSATVAGHAGPDAAPDTDDDAARPGCESRDATGSRTEPAQRRDAAAHADRDGLEGVGRQLDEQRDAHRRRSADVAWGQYEPAIRRWEAVLGRPAPAPTEPGTRGGQRLSPRLTEWMMGWPDGWVTDVPGISRNDALKICGNGVVPQQAAEAMRRLAHLGERAA